MMSKSSLKTADLPKKRKYHRASTLSDAEIMVILILFHSSGYRCLKRYPSEVNVLRKRVNDFRNNIQPIPEWRVNFFRMDMQMLIIKA